MNIAPFTACSHHLHIATNSSVSAGCGEPISPGNGFVVQFESAEVGAQIIDQCMTGLIWGAQNRSWTPDPAKLLCQEPPQGWFSWTCISILWRQPNSSECLDILVMTLDLISTFCTILPQRKNTFSYVSWVSLIITMQIGSSTKRLYTFTTNMLKVYLGA